MMFIGALLALVAVQPALATPHIAKRGLELSYGYYSISHAATGQSLAVVDERLVGTKDAFEQLFEIQPHNASTPYMRIRPDNTNKCISVQRVGHAHNVDKNFIAHLLGCNVDPQVAPGLAPQKQLWTLRPLGTIPESYNIISTDEPVGITTALALAKCSTGNGESVTCLRKLPQKANTDFSWFINVKPLTYGNDASAANATVAVILSGEQLQAVSGDALARHRQQQTFAQQGFEIVVKPR